MALRRGFTQSRVARAPRRQTSWSVGPGGSSLTAISASANTILGGAVQVVPEGSTLVRTHGSFQAYLASANAIDSGFHAALGITLVSNEAFNAGSAAIPDPLLDVDWEGWLFHRLFDLHAVDAAPATNPVNQLTSIQFAFDSKAMRKFDVGLSLVGMLGTAENGTSAAMGVWFDSRVLIKLA